MSDLDNIAATMRLVASDCADDAARLDTTAFTARGVGETFGATLAMVAAVARATAALADSLAATRRDLDSRTEHAW